MCVKVSGEREPYVAAAPPETKTRDGQRGREKPKQGARAGVEAQGLAADATGQQPHQERLPTNARTHGP